MGVRRVAMKDVKRLPIQQASQAPSGKKVGLPARGKRPGIDSRSASSLDERRARLRKQRGTDAPRRQALKQIEKLLLPAAPGEFSIEVESLHEPD